MLLLDKKIKNKYLYIIMEKESEKQFFVYLLVSSTGATYVGATVDLNRRLRQHNKEIKGGAHATRAKV